MRPTVTDMLESALAGRRLLTHPFYVRWSEGLVTREELAAYAAQYRHIEAAQPVLLAQLAGDVSAPVVRRNIDDTLADELGTATATGTSHLELFGDFARAVGAPDAAAPTAATSALLDTLQRLVASSPAEGLAGLAAYELQSPEVSRSKADGLHRHYGLDGQAIAFWETHAVADVAHAGWVVEALERLNPAPATLLAASRAAADAWWAMLDEREAAAA